MTKESEEQILDEGLEKALDRIERKIDELRLTRALLISYSSLRQDYKELKERHDALLDSNIKASNNLIGDLLVSMLEGEKK